MIEKHPILGEKQSQLPSLAAGRYYVRSTPSLVPPLGNNMSTFEELLKIGLSLYPGQVFSLPKEDQEEFLALAKAGKLKRTVKGTWAHTSVSLGDEALSEAEVHEMVWAAIQEVMNKRLYFTGNYILNSVRGRGVGTAGVTKAIAALYLDGKIHEFRGQVTKNTKQKAYTIFTDRESITRALEKGPLTATDLTVATGFDPEYLKPILEELISQGSVLVDGRKYILFEAAPARRRIKRR